jgi:uncharacterized protein (TIGR00299 family) protein
MPRLLYFDCFAGASGDMVLGALLDAGLPLDELRHALGSLTIGGYEVVAERVSRAGVAATRFRLHEAGSAGHESEARHAPGDHAQGGHEHEYESGPPAGPTPDHVHGPDEPHAHRALAEIAALIRTSALSDAARNKAIALFRRLAEAEAAIHQMPIEQVHLHEVGALDSIIDIVGAVFAIEWFGVDQIAASPLNVGGGTVRSAHGTFPVPAPATVALLKGVPIYSNGQQVELVTPTGALLVTSYATEYGPLPAMAVQQVGYGAGSRDLPGVPNTLRVLIGDVAARRAGDRVVVLECEIDDMNPQLYGLVMERLYATGALEVFYSPVYMKKQRPATLMTVVTVPGRSEAMKAILFSETTTIGLRYQEVERECLEREMVLVETPLGPVRFKLARRGGQIVNSAPEFDDCVRIAAEKKVPVKQVLAQAAQAYLNR